VTIKHLRLGLVLGLSLGPLAAQSSYVISTIPGTNIGVVAAKYQLSIVKSWQSSTNSLTSVTSTLPITATEMYLLKSEPGVLAVDTNKVVAGSESDPASVSQATLNGIGRVVASPKYTMYYGDEVWTSYVNQPGTQLIELNSALTGFGGGSGVVAIIDTGADLNHPGLRGALVPGYDFSRNRPDTVSELNDVSPEIAAALQQSTVEILDANNIVPILAQSTVEILDQSTVEILDGGSLPRDFGHGTMVAGLVHLVAPRAQIMPLKAFTADGTAQLIDVASAIYYATDHGANVINMSFGYREPSPILYEAVTYARNHGVILVASSGNLGRQMVEFPAGYELVEGVGSTNLSDQRSTFSNYGQTTDTSAPGEDVVTLFPGGHYAAAWGTSFSSALVAGAAALMHGIDPSLSAFSFRNALNQGVPINQGMGPARLDLVPSLNYLLAHP
jgi:subtilisin family serine protease